MNKLRIYIVEDMAITRLSLTRVLEEAGHTVIGSSAKARRAFEKISITPIDMVLVDINLIGREDGIWLAQKIRSELSVPFVFLTSLGDSSILEKVNTTEPDGYIMKPFNIPSLLTTIQIAFSRHQDRNKQADNDVRNDEKGFLMLQSGLATSKVHYHDMLYLKSDGNYVHCYHLAGSGAVRTTIKSLDDKLPSHQFVKISQSCIVAIGQINGIENRTVVLSNNERLTISRSRLKHVKAAFSG